MTTTWVLSADVNMLAGQAVTGIVKIEAVGVNPGGVTVPIPAIRDTVDNHIWSGPQRIKLIDGQLMTTLEDPVLLPDSTGVANPGMSPASWSYRVTLQLDHLQKSDYPVYVFQLGSDLDLADVVSVPPATDPLDNPWQDAAEQTAADRAAVEAIQASLGREAPGGIMGLGSDGKIQTPDRLSKVLPARRLDEWILTPGADNSTQINAAHAAARTQGFALVATPGVTYRGYRIDNTGVTCDWRGATLKHPDGVAAGNLFEPTGACRVIGGTFDGNKANTTDPGSSTAGCGLYIEACKPWVSSTAYAVGAKVSTTAGRMYVATTAGTSGATAPTGTGTGISDGTVVWSWTDQGWTGQIRLESGPVFQNLWEQGVNAVGIRSITDAEAAVTGRIFIQNPTLSACDNGLYFIGLAGIVVRDAVALDCVTSGVSTNRCNRPTITGNYIRRCGSHGYVSVHTVGDEVDGDSSYNTKSGFVWGGADPSGTYLPGRLHRIGKIVANYNGLTNPADKWQGVTFDPTIAGMTGIAQQIDAKAEQIVAIGNGLAGLQVTAAKDLFIASITTDGNGTHGISLSGQAVTMLSIKSRNNVQHAVAEFGSTSQYGGHVYGTLDASGNGTTNGVFAAANADARIPSQWLANPGAQTIVSTGTLTVDALRVGRVKITALAAALTIANPTGVPAPMQGLILRIKDNGTARALTFGSQFRGLAAALPSTTVAGKTLYMGFMWNADATKWDMIAYTPEP